MKTVSKQTIGKELVKLNLALSAQKGTKEIRIITDIWFEDCGHMSEDRFLEAVARYRQKSRWWPAPADVIKEHDTIVAIVREPPALPMPELTPAEIEQNKRWVRNLLEKCGLGSRNKQPRACDPKHAERVKRQAEEILNHNA